MVFNINYARSVTLTRSSSAGYGGAHMGEPKVPPIGPRIRAERIRREVTIRALARVIGVSPSLISQIETGKSQPSVSTLYAMSSALGLPLEELFNAGDDAAAAAAVSSDITGLRYLDTDRSKGSCAAMAFTNCCWVRCRVITSTSCS